MATAISPGVSVAASVSRIFYFDFPWFDCRFAETKTKWKQNAQTHWNTGGC